MGSLVVWHGTPEEGRAIVDALAHNCDCEFGVMGMRVKTCAPHRAFTEDQRFCDWLIFYRRYWAVHRLDGKDVA